MFLVLFRSVHFEFIRSFNPHHYTENQTKLRLRHSCKNMRCCQSISSLVKIFKRVCFNKVVSDNCCQKQFLTPKYGVLSSGNQKYELSQTKKTQPKNKIKLFELSMVYCWYFYFFWQFFQFSYCWKVEIYLNIPYVNWVN